MKTIHQKYHESGTDIGIVQEAKEIEERKHRQIQGRQQGFGIVKKLKKEKIILLIMCAVFNNCHN